MIITFDESTGSQIAEAIQEAEWVVEQPSIEINVRFDASKLIAGLKSLRDQIRTAINRIDKMNAAFQDRL